jgi:hypothetical protein
MQRFQALLAVAIICAVAPATTAFAGYLTFSGNWTAPSTVPMSTRTATKVVHKCPTVQTYRNLPAANTGATVVAGPHTTQADHNLHITVRLYTTGVHTKSCHVYVGKNNAYTSCSCVYAD